SWKPAERRRQDTPERPSVQQEERPREQRWPTRGGNVEAQERERGGNDRRREPETVKPADPDREILRRFFEPVSEPRKGGSERGSERSGGDRGGSERSGGAWGDEQRRGSERHGGGESGTVERHTPPRNEPRNEPRNQPPPPRVEPAGPAPPPQADKPKDHKKEH